MIEGDVEHGMQLDRVRRHAILSMVKVEEPDADEDREDAGGRGLESWLAWDSTVYPCSSTSKLGRTPSEMDIR